MEMRQNADYDVRDSWLPDATLKVPLDLGRE